MSGPRSLFLLRRGHRHSDNVGTKSGSRCTRSWGNTERRQCARGAISLAPWVIYGQTLRLHLLDLFTSLERIMVFMSGQPRPLRVWASIESHKLRNRTQGNDLSTSESEETFTFCGPRLPASVRWFALLLFFRFPNRRYQIILLSFPFFRSTSAR